jgi:hypothetical protein
MAMKSCLARFPACGGRFARLSCRATKSNAGLLAAPRRQSISQVLEGTAIGREAQMSADMDMCRLRSQLQWCRTMPGRQQNTNVYTGDLDDQASPLAEESRQRVMRAVG